MDNYSERSVMRIQLAGRPMALRYSINSMCDIEDRAGMPLDRLMDLHFSATRLLLWAGLRQCQPELTVRDVGELIGECLRSGDSLEDIVQLCAEGMRVSGLIGGD